MTKRIVMGIDGSLTSTGIAVIDGNNGNVIAYDNIPIKAKDFGGDESLKIHHIAKTIVEICKAYEVTHIAIENSFVSKNGRTGITLSRLAGGIMTLLIDNGYTMLYLYTPSQWRKTVTGVGNKTKEGTAKYIQSHIIDIGKYSDKSNKNKTSDLYDSIGLAYCLYKRINNL